MKIDRLYTLSQFIDLVGQTDKNHEKCYGNVEIYKEAKNKCVSMVVLIADKIIAYNEFLKQPLSKEMFVNENLKEFYLDNSNEQKIRLIEWQEAEKKVIFEEIPYEYKSMIMECLFQDCTLLDVANYSNGQLKTKNIEL